MTLVARASRKLGLTASVSSTGSLAFPYLYPWPQHREELIDEAFTELAKRWRPILDVCEENGVDIGLEIHPGEDVFDGVMLEVFLEKLNGHQRCQVTYDPSHAILQ